MKINMTAATKTLAAVSRNAAIAAKKHMPKILTGVGIAGSVGCTVLAVRATPRALELIEAKKKELGKDRLTFLEKAQATWRCYVPATISGMIGTGCLVSSGVMSDKRVTEMAGALALSQAALEKVHKELPEIVGEEKASEIENKLAKAVPKPLPDTTDSDSVIFRCCDDSFGREFKASVNQLDHAVNVVNSRLNAYGYASLNEFYGEIPDATAEFMDAGDLLGWNRDRDGLVTINHWWREDKSGRPYIVYNFVGLPKYDFDK